MRKIAHHDRYQFMWANADFDRRDAYFTSEIGHSRRSWRRRNQGKPGALKTRFYFASTDLLAGTEPPCSQGGTCPVSRMLKIEFAEEA